MVFHGTIPFGAPSQLRLQLSVDDEGAVYFNILNPFDQNMGNLHHMRVSPSELRAVASDQAEKAVAQGEKATLEVTRSTDQSHEALHIHYVDSEHWTDSQTTVAIEDLLALIDGVADGGGPAASAAADRPVGLKGVKGVMGVLAVSDVEASLKFYTEQLGFTDSWSIGTPPTYGGAKVGDFEMHVRRVENVAPGTGLGLYIEVEDVDGLYGQCVAKGLRLVDEVADRPYKMRDFMVSDPDGIEIGFGKPL